MKYHELANPTQREPLDETQVENSAGGYVYELDKFGRLERFLILGSDQPTYYASARDLTRENTQCVKDCWQADPNRTGGIIVDLRYKAPKADPCLYALAIGFAHANEDARKVAKMIFPKVIGNASNLFSFLEAATTMRGWGRGLKEAVQRWYESRKTDQLAYQMVKYGERVGFNHKRCLELAHPRVGDDEARGAMFRHARGKDVDTLKLPPQYHAYVEAKKAATEDYMVELIEKFDLPWDAVPKAWLNKPRVRRATVPNMPLGAFTRQLGLLTKMGVLERGDMAKLEDEEALKKSHLHPYSVLLALATYREGRGMRATWDPYSWVLSTLNDTFYRCFDNVEPTGKRICLALDVSASMTWSHVQGGPLDAREASAAMALVQLQHDMCDVMAFSHQFRSLPLHKRMSLEEAVKTVSDLPHGGTDCSLPMKWAADKGHHYDAFVIYTDSETWAGHEHPVVTLQKYRKKFVGDAKLIVVGMTATNFTIANPADPGMLDVVGFDAAAPKLINDFIRG